MQTGKIEGGIQSVKINARADDGGSRSRINSDAIQQADVDHNAAVD